LLQSQIIKINSIINYNDIMKNTKILFWIVFLGLVTWGFYSLSNVLMPFIMSFVFSYFFVPLANFLQRKFFINRTVSAVIIIVLILICLVSLWLLVIPLIFEQIQHFIQQIPKYKEYVKTQIIPLIAHYAELIDPSYVARVEENLNNLFSIIFVYTSNFIQRIWQSGMAIINILSMLVLVPFITFYIIRDWKNILSSVLKVVPQNSKESFKFLISKIDIALSGFIRGQLNVCLVLAIYYCITLTTIGINFSIFIGITTGILTFIPFVGLLSGFICASLVAYLQFFAIKKVFMVVIIFVIGSIIENTLSPKLIGDKIGLHPVWLIFALLVGANLFGFVGILSSIPCAAVLNILIRFMLEQYYKSEFYLDQNYKKIKN
jgi:putative permease